MNKRNNFKSYIENIDKEEFDANTAISNLINNIIILVKRKDPLIKSILSPNLLIRGLRELEAMIEMVDIKNSMVNQIMFLITNQSRKRTNSCTESPTSRNEQLSSSKETSNSTVGIRKFNFEGHMLHCVISGNPGTGKTTVCKILAKIWMSLGLINKQKKSEDSDANDTVVSDKVIIKNQNNESRIKELEKSLHNSRRKLNYVKELVTKNYVTSCDIRANVIKLKPSNNQKLCNNSLRPKVCQDNPDTHKKSVQNFIYNTNVDIDWDILLLHTRNLRFGLEEIIKEINVKNITGITDSIDNTTNIIEPIDSIDNIEIIHATDMVGTTGATGATDTTGTIDTNDTTGVVDIIEVDEIDPYENINPNFVIASRDTLIAEFLGQTAPKTKRVLESARGGVLFIDEAYSLCNMGDDSRDKYGEECLTTINEFMSLYPDEIIIIFSGYKDKLLESIFQVQPGLMRRIANFFEIKDYTHKGLAKIFKQQLSRDSWVLSSDIDIIKIFTKKEYLIRDGGGFTEKLAYFVKLIYGKTKFTEIINNSNTALQDSIITKSMIYEALDIMEKNHNPKYDSNIPNIYL